MGLGKVNRGFLQAGFEAFLGGLGSGWHAAAGCGHQSGSRLQRSPRLGGGQHGGGGWLRSCGFEPCLLDDAGREPETGGEKAGEGVLEINKMLVCRTHQDGK